MLTPSGAKKRNEHHQKQDEININLTITMTCKNKHNAGTWKMIANTMAFQQKLRDSKTYEGTHGGEQTRGTEAADSV